MKKVLLTLLVPIVLAVVLITCAKQEKEQEKQAAPLADESAVAVKLTSVKEGDYRLPIVSSGLISTGTESRLAFKVGGVVSKILVEEGETVAKGQVLASLDLTEIDAQVSQAKNNVDKTKRDLERVQRLYSDSAATLEQLQNSQTAYDVANEGHRVAMFNKQYSIIRATNSGKVLRKLVNEGELVGPGTPVFMVNAASENDWIVRVGLPDVDWVRVKKGDDAIVKTDAYPDEKFQAKVVLVSDGADPVSGLYPVEVQINPKGKRLATGLVANVEIVSSETQRLKSVPIEAIVEGNGAQAYVFVALENQQGVKKIPVKIAYLNGNDAMITSGLENVQQVITSGSAFLTEFSSIKIVDSAQLTANK